MCPPSVIFDISRNHPVLINSANVIPNTQVSQAAYTHAASILAPAILNHSIRVYLYAAALAKHTNSSYNTNATKLDLLFTACLFHDVGTTPTYNGSARFEIEGADAAVKHLSDHHIMSGRRLRYTQVRRLQRGLAS
jgi:HD superfamily phosphodiesterase